jgi:hypothetical protein
LIRMKDLKLGTDPNGFGFGEGDFGVGPFGDYYDFYHDIQLKNGDLELVSDGLEVVQAAKIAILFIRGDWFLNLLEGLPWFTEMFNTQVSFTTKRDYIKEAILNTYGVTRIDSFNFGPDNSERKANISFKVLTDFDTTEDGTIIL